jgi:hypothetical protein
MSEDEYKCEHGQELKEGMGKGVYVCEQLGIVMAFNVLLENPINQYVRSSNFRKRCNCQCTLDWKAPTNPQYCHE